MADKVFAAERTRQAIAAAEGGSIQDARSLLAEALTLDPDYELAWLWFAAIAEEDGEKKFCLQRAQRLNPYHRASPSLLGLAHEKPRTPPELRPIVDPPPPEFVSTYVADMRAKRRRRLLVQLLAAVVVVALLAGLLALLSVMQRKPVHIAVVAGDNVPGADGGQEYLASAQWAVDDWNASNGNSQHPLELDVYYDDNDPAKAAEVARQIVGQGQAIAVVGHQLSSTSEVAGPIYAEAGIPVITPTATADQVTVGNEWYFRTVFDNRSQGDGIAAYVDAVMQTDMPKRAVIVSTDDSYGQTLRQGFVRSYGRGGTIQADLVVSADPAQQRKDLAAAAARIAKIDNLGPVVLASLDPGSSVLAQDLQDRGVTPQIVGTDALANTPFFRGLQQASADAINKGLAATPLTDGSLFGEAVTFYEAFTQRYGYRPGWSAGLTYDAVDAISEAMTRADVDYDEAVLPDSRRQVRDMLAAARDPETGLQVLTGTLYFDDQGSAVRPVAMEDGRVSPNGQVTVESAPYQLAPFSPTAGVTLDEEIENGGAVVYHGTAYTFQRVVTTGFNINSIIELDAATQTFNADFFVWFKFLGKPRNQTDVVFVNAVDQSLSLGEPQRLTQVEGQNYVLYRVVGTFKAPMEFSEFPFDEQSLPIVIQNRDRPASKITYVVDPDNLEQSQATRLESGVDAGSTIDQIPNWQADSLTFSPMSVGNTSSLGDPYFTAGSQGITYSQMAATVKISRDVGSFLVKNLLPLVLLTAVTYISLWLPVSEGARISFAVTGILTGAVMLAAVTGSLPQVDYTVAIEWAYYAFIALSALCVLVALIGRTWEDGRRLSSVRTLNRAARVAYPLIVLAVAVAYVAMFRG